MYVCMYVSQSERERERERERKKEKVVYERVSEYAKVKW